MADASSLLMPDPVDADATSTDQERQQAMVAALRRQRALGALGQLSGDTVLAPLGQSLETDADRQERLGETAYQRQLQSRQIAQMGQYQQGELASRASALDLQRQEMNRRRYQQDGTGGVLDTWTGRRVAGPSPQATGTSSLGASTDNPLAGLKPNEIEKLWSSFATGVGTASTRGRLPGQLQQRLESAERLEALVLGPGGQIQNLTPQQVRESSTALANLISGGGSSALGQIEELVPHTLAGRFAGLKQELLNKPEGADAQAFLQNMLETAAREKRVTLNQMHGLQLQAVPNYMRLRRADPVRFDAILRGVGLDPAAIDDKGLRVSAAPALATGAAGGTPATMAPGPHGTRVKQNGTWFRWNGQSYEPEAVASAAP